MKRLTQLWKYMRKSIAIIRQVCPGILFLKSVYALFQAVKPFVTIVLTAYILDGILARVRYETLTGYLGFLLLMNFGMTVVIHLLEHRNEVLQLKFDQEYEFLLNRKIMEMDYASIEDVKIHQLREKINEIHAMNGGGIHAVVSVFPEILMHLVTIVVAATFTYSLFQSSGYNVENSYLCFASSGWSSVLLIVLVIGNVYISMWSNTAMTGNMYRIMDDIIPFNRVFGYYLDNYISTYHAGKDIRIYGEQNLIREESMSLFDDCKRTLGRLSDSQKKYTGLVAFSSALMNTLIYLLIGLRGMAGIIGIGMIVQYIGCLQSFTSGIIGFMTSLSELQANEGATQILFEFLEISSKMHVKERAVVPKRKIENREKLVFEFQDVSFRYPGSDTMVLKHLSVKINSSDSIAIVGQNGSGKTTFIKLLCRLYEPTEGRILLNGIPIQEYDIEEYRTYFSVVFQDFCLFPFTLGWNVSGKMNGDRRQIEENLVKAGFGERLRQLKRGIDTPLYRDFSEEGVEISGGEAQKIALARALYKDAPIVILDEPTAALDPVAEYEFYVHLKENVFKKTAIFVSHRLASCKFCEKIMVFSQGEIIQVGSHEELIRQRQGKYWELWNAQAEYYLEQ